MSLFITKKKKKKRRGKKNGMGVGEEEPIKKKTYKPLGKTSDGRAETYGKA